MHLLDLLRVSAIIYFFVFSNTLLFVLLFLPGGSGHRCHEVVFSCGIGSLDMRTASDEERRSRMAVLQGLADHGTSSSSSSSAAPKHTDPLHQFQEQQESHCNKQFADMQNSDDAQPNQILTWRSWRQNLETTPARPSVFLPFPPSLSLQQATNQVKCVCIYFLTPMSYLTSSFIPC